MYYIRPRGHKNVILNDLNISLRSYNDGTIITNEQYNNSLNIKQLEPNLIIIPIDDEITNSLVKRELFYIKDNNQIIKLKNGEYEPGDNSVTVFYNGRVLNTNNFIEIDNKTIKLKNKLSDNKDIVIIQYVDKNIVLEKYNQPISYEQQIIEFDQTKLNLSFEISKENGEIILLFIDGILQNNDCFKINNNKQIEFLAPLGEKAIITIINFDITKMV